MRRRPTWNAGGVTTATAPEALPHWDPTDLFPSPGDRSFVGALEEVAADVARLGALYDRHSVGGGEPHEPSAGEVAAFDEVLAETNRVEARLRLLDAYVHAYVTTDSTDAVAQARASELDRTSAGLRQLAARLTAWVAALGADSLVAASAAASEHRGPLRRIEVRATHQMSPAEESLYAELQLTGASAWARLHGDLTSQFCAAVELPGGTEVLPMTAIRNLATDPDPARRRAGYRAELAAWPTLEVPLASALNAVKGEATVVNARRRWDDPLAASLFANSVGPATFAAMQAAVDDSLDDFRRWMRCKAALHGHAGALPWWDLFAPCPVNSGTVTFSPGFITPKNNAAGLMLTSGRTCPSTCTGICGVPGSFVVSRAWPLI